MCISYGNITNMSIVLYFTHNVNIVINIYYIEIQYDELPLNLPHVLHILDGNDFK